MKSRPRFSFTLTRASTAMLISTMTWLCAASLQAESVGRVGTLEVSVEEIRRSIGSLEPAQLESIKQDPAMLEQLVRSLLVQKLVLKEATSKKWHEEPAIVAKLERTRDSTLTESFLESVSQPPASYPSEEEVRSAYEAGRESFQQPRSFRLAQIFIADSADAEKKIQGLKKQLKDTKTDFAELAQKNSQESVSAARGGEIGWVTEAQIEPELRTHVTGLKFNEISPPILLKDGWHLLKLLDARAAYTPTLEQVKPSLIRQLRQDKLRANTQSYLATLLKEHPLVLNESVLRSTLPEPSK